MKSTEVLKPWHNSTVAGFTHSYLSLASSKIAQVFQRFLCRLNTLCLSPAQILLWCFRGSLAGFTLSMCVFIFKVSSSVSGDLVLTMCIWFCEVAQALIDGKGISLVGERPRHRLLASRAVVLCC